MSISDSKEESLNVSSSKEGKIWKEGSDENFNLNLKYSKKKHNQKLSLISMIVLMQILTINLYVLVL